MLQIEFSRAKQYKVKLTRGQKGGYGWEITFLGEDSQEVVKEIAKIDKMLKKVFLPGEGEK